MKWIAITLMASVAFPTPQAIEERFTSHNANSSRCLCSVCVGDTAHKNRRQSFVLVAVVVLWVAMMAVSQVRALLLFQGKH
jgi:hypothetical protein